MIKIDGHNLSVEEVALISRKNETITVSAKAMQSMKKSRKFVEKIIKDQRSVYGINTGFGPLSRTRISNEELNLHQNNLLHHLSVGQGELFNNEDTRSIILARANALTRGYSGIRPLVVQRLIEFLNHQVFPEIPKEGSVGASGDLVPLAHLARAIIGLGYVRYKNKRVKASSLNKTLGFQPISLQAKEGLALVNGTSVMTGVASLCVTDAMNLLSIAEIISAFYVEVMYGEPEPFCPRVSQARGHRGQFVVADRIVSILKSNKAFLKEIDDHKWGVHEKPVEAGIDIQDPYSLRCVPQVLGAFQDALWHIYSVVTRELNATTDNPLIFPNEEMVIHCGNFYGQHVSVVMDYLRINLAKMALLVERQTERLMNEKYNLGLSPMLSQGKLGLNSGMMGCQLLATSLACEIRMLSQPASMQTIPTNANNQDVVSMGTISAKHTSQMITMIWKIMSIQSLALCQAYDLRGKKLNAGKSFKKFHQLIREISPELKKDRPLYLDIDKTTNLLKSEQFQKEFKLQRPLTA